MASVIETKGISFTEKNLDVFKYLKNQGNASKYVIELIRKDMQGEREKEPEINEMLLKRMIREEVTKCIDAYDFKPEKTTSKKKVAAPAESKVQDAISNEVMDCVKDLLDL
jgi:nitrate/TMAO reductase-like tetraheme cytochrome c subunit